MASSGSLAIQPHHLLYALNQHLRLPQNKHHVYPTTENRDLESYSPQYEYEGQVDGLSAL